MSLIAMIPARMGSVRIPRKNVRYLGGKPLLAHAVDLAVGSGLFDEVWVNTESELLGELGVSHGAMFHKRPERLATGDAKNHDFTYEFLKAHPCDYVVMVNTTSPLVRPGTLAKLVSLVKSGEFDTVLSVVEEQAESFFDESPVNFGLDEKINSQDIKPISKVIWALTAWRSQPFLELYEAGQTPTFGGKLGLFPIPKDESCDLDTPEDWAIAEGMLLARFAVGEEPRYWQDGTLR